MRWSLPSALHGRRPPPESSTPARTGSSGTGETDASRHGRSGRSAAAPAAGKRASSSAGAAATVAGQEERCGGCSEGRQEDSPPSLTERSDEAHAVSACSNSRAARRAGAGSHVAAALQPGFSQRRSHASSPEQEHIKIPLSTTHLFNLHSSAHWTVPSSPSAGTPPPPDDAVLATRDKLARRAMLRRLRAPRDTPHLAGVLNRRHGRARAEVPHLDRLVCGAR